MEGICLVLEHARHISYLLDERNLYSLLIRLLIGLEQYSEMIYAFDLLFKSKQFDNLLITISQINDERMNTALIDYIKRYHPNDKLAFTSISMNLNMHHELAMMHQDAGKNLLESSQFHPQLPPGDMSVTLQSLFQYYSDAADTFYLAGCCRQSELCLKQARLCSLQIDFLQKSPIVIILKLNAAQLRDLLPRLERCWHAFIIADAYNEHSFWPLCLIEQFLCTKYANGKDYWNEFQQLVPIDDQLILNIGKNLVKKNFNSISAKNFQEILSFVMDSNVLYRLQELLTRNDKNYSDLFTSMDSPYLLDTMRVT